MAAWAISNITDHFLFDRFSILLILKDAEIEWKSCISATDKLRYELVRVKYFHEVEVDWSIILKKLNYHLG